MQPIRRIIYYLSFLIGKQTPTVFILCYHSFKKNDWKFSVDPETFEKQIQYLMSKFNYVSIPNLPKLVAKADKTNKTSFSITIDDGYKSIKNIVSICDRYEIKPTVFLLADSDNANWTELGTNENFLSKADVNELKKRGWTFGSHTMTHENLLSLPIEEHTTEIVGSKIKLQKTLGAEVKYFAFPKGKYNSISEKLVKKAGYKMAFTMDDGIITTSTNLLRLPRVGVDRSHGYSEFKNIFLTNSILFRRFIKKFISI